MDVTDGDSVQDSFDEILNEIEAVDVLNNNAGIMYDVIKETFSIDQSYEQSYNQFYKGRIAWNEQSRQESNYQYQFHC